MPAPVPDPRSPAPAWRCCWPTVDETTLSLCVPTGPDGPWLIGRALDVIRAGGDTGPARQDQGRYATGRRRGAPLLLGEPLTWCGVDAVVEATQPDGQPTGELTLRLPPWDRLAAAVAESALWELADALAAELRAACGIVDDGRAVGFPDLLDPRRTAARLQRRHLGIIVPPPWLPLLRPGSTAYRALPESGLTVVLR